MTEKSKLSASEKFWIGILITILGIVVSLFVPEVRHFLGFKNNDEVLAKLDTLQYENRHINGQEKPSVNLEESSESKRNSQKSTLSQTQDVNDNGTKVVNVENSNLTQTIVEKQKLNLSSENFSVFEFVINESGTLTITLESFVECTFFSLFNEDGFSLYPKKKEIVAGQEHNGYCYIPNFIRYLGDTGARFSKNDKVMPCYWSTSADKFKGNYTFALDAGTYYLRFLCKGHSEEADLSTANLSIKFKALIK